MRSLRALPLAALLACGSAGTPPVARVVGAGSARPAAAAPPVARQLTHETTIATRSGTPLAVPKGWWLTEGQETVLLEDPDRALKAWLCEVPEADGAQAIASAWERVAPELHLTGDADRPPPTGGWDAITTVSYDAGGDRLVEATARRHGAITYVLLVNGARAAVLRRRAQLEQMRESVRPAGLREESFAGRTPKPIDAQRARELDTFVESAFERLEVPGAVIAVVEGGAVVYERALGLRALGKKDLVTQNTLFLIGSISKPMTSMMQATLVDAGVFDWETPVTSVLPSFALGDPELTRKIAMWHMSCACTGMPRNDFEHIFQYENVSAEALIASMKPMKPTTALGETFQYSNLMFATGGYIAAHAYEPKASLGDAYQSAMQHKVFGPIGMKSTTVDFSAALRAEHASPHATAIDGTVRPMPVEIERNVITIRPAGGVWSNLHDMERYVMTEMTNGVAPDGKRVVTEKNSLARRAIRTGDPLSGGYGLGLDVGQYQGLSMIAHDGGAFGFGTSMFILPDQQIGIIVLTNVRNGAPTEYLPFNAVVKRRIIETLFEGAAPLAAAELDYFTKGKAQSVTAALSRVELVPDRERMKRLAGSYENARLGSLVLRPTASGAILDAGEWSGAVGQRIGRDGTMTLVFLDPPFPGAEYTVGGDDTSPTLTVTDGQLSYTFTREATHR